MSNDRPKISLQDSLVDIIVKMSERNPGAVEVLSGLAKEFGDDGTMLMLNLDDMNIRGSRIWLGFKDFAGQNMEVFRAAILSRDAEMVRIINAAGREQDEQAVERGASFG